MCSGMWRYVTGPVVNDIPKNCSAFKISGTAQPVEMHHIPQDKIFKVITEASAVYNDYKQMYTAENQSTYVE